MYNDFLITFLLKKEKKKENNHINILNNQHV